MIEIYTDGSSIQNPGPGGYAAILKYGDKRKEICCGFEITTNNRMELWAVIAGVQAVKKELQDITVYSDSRYVVDSIEKQWLHKWVKKDFKDRKNSDLWKIFWLLYQKHNIKMVWVKGHDGNLENENCDKLATEMSRADNCKCVDYGYVNSLSQK